jgi:hypothetical protein
MIIHHHTMGSAIPIVLQTADALAGQFRKRAMYVLSRMCKRTSMLPNSCRIKEDIQHITSDPLFMGGFADVYRGQLGTRNVALKVLRVYGNRNGDEVLRVGPSLYPVLLAAA